MRRWGAARPVTHGGRPRQTNGMNYLAGLTAPIRAARYALYWLALAMWRPRWSGQRYRCPGVGCQGPCSKRSGRVRGVGHARGTRGPFYVGTRPHTTSISAHRAYATIRTRHKMTRTRKQREALDAGRAAWNRRQHELGGILQTPAQATVLSEGRAAWNRQQREAAEARRQAAAASRAVAPAPRRKAPVAPPPSTPARPRAPRARAVVAPVPQPAPKRPQRTAQPRIRQGRPSTPAQLAALYRGATEPQYRTERRLRALATRRQFLRAEYQPYVASRVHRLLAIMEPDEAVFVASLGSLRNAAARRIIAQRRGDIAQLRLQYRILGEKKSPAELIAGARSALAQRQRDQQAAGRAVPDYGDASPSERAKQVNAGRYDQDAAAGLWRYFLSPKTRPRVRIRVREVGSRTVRIGRHGRRGKLIA